MDPSKRSMQAEKAHPLGQMLITSGLGFHVLDGDKDE